MGSITDSRYRELAGAIVARAVEDLVDVLVFMRDISNDPASIHLLADENYVELQYTLDKNRNKKRRHREARKAHLKTARILEEAVSEHENTLKTWQGTLDELNTKLRVERKKSIKVRRLMPIKREIQDALMHIERELRFIADSRKRIEAALEKANEESKLIEDMKSHERKLRERATYKGQRKYLLYLANIEVRNLHKWFYSDQFSTLSDLDPQGLIDTANRKVREGLQVPDNQKLTATYFLGRDK